MATSAKDASLVLRETRAEAAAPWRALALRLKHLFGVDRAIAYTVLARVSAAYKHALHPQGRTKMMQDWADFLEHAQRGAKVLSFPDRTA